MQHLDEGTLQAWLDGDRSGLDPDEVERVEQHVAACDVCAASVEALRASTERAMSLLGTRAAEGPPPFAAIRARAEKVGTAEGTETTARTGRERGWGSMSWAASIAVALGAGWLANDFVRRPGGGGGAFAGDEAAKVEAATVEAAAEVGGPSAGGEAVAERQAAEARGESGAVVAEAEQPAAGQIPSIEIPPPPPVSAADRAAEAEATGANSRFVRGRVVDASSGRPLESVQVFLPSLARGALTGSDGRFALMLEDSLAGSGAELTLGARVIGYTELSQPFVLPSGDTVMPDMRLESTALRLQELVVTGVIEEESRPSAGAIPPVRVDGSEVWLGIEEDEAEADAGFQPLTVPDLQVVSVETTSIDGRVVLRVTQELEAGARLELIQALRPVTLEGDAGGRTVSSRRVGTVWVVGLAAVPPQTLNGLLERVR